MVVRKRAVSNVQNALEAIHGTSVCVRRIRGENGILDAQRSVVEDATAALA